MELAEPVDSKKSSSGMRLDYSLARFRSKYTILQEFAKHRDIPVSDLKQIINNKSKHTRTVKSGSFIFKIPYENGLIVL